MRREEKAKKDKMSNEVERKGSVLSRSIQSAYLNIFATVVARAFSFIFNAIIFRQTPPEALGIAVRCTLLADTVYFVSREMFRKTCLTRPEKDRDWRGTINLVWLGVPVGTGASACLAYVWVAWLDPVPEHLIDQYCAAVFLVCVACVILLTTEVFYIVGQAYMHVKFRAFIDFYAYFQLQILTIVLISLDSRYVTLYNGVAALANALIVIAVHLVYFYGVVHRDRKLDKEEDIPFESMAEFLPDFHPTTFYLDNDRFRLAKSFFKQGFLKQMLTEGEKYMITWFSLMSLSQQGVYDVICNLGSLPARLLFSKLEESSHLYFSQTVKRGDRRDRINAEAEPSKHLNIVVRGLIIFGLVVITFGMSYSQLLLFLYGGDKLSSQLSVSLLRAHCVYVLFCAVNGVTESYAFNAMTEEQVSWYNRLMMAMTGVFLMCVWVLARILGPVGFTLANICNLTMRIGYNFWVIHKRHRLAEVKPLKGILPKTPLLIFLVFSGIVCFFSEFYVYQSGSLIGTVLHLGIGGVMFITSVGMILLTEDKFRDKVVAFATKKPKAE